MPMLFTPFGILISFKWYCLQNAPSLIAVIKGSHNIAVPEGVVKIWTRAFEGEGCESVILPSTLPFGILISFKWYCLQNAPSLIAVMLPSSGIIEF